MPLGEVRAQKLKIYYSAFFQWLYQHLCNSLHGRWCKKRLVPRLINQLHESSATSGSHVQCVWTDQAVSESRGNQPEERVSGVCSFWLSQRQLNQGCNSTNTVKDKEPLTIIWEFFFCSDMTWKDCQNVFRKTKTTSDDQWLTILWRWELFQMLSFEQDSGDKLLHNQENTFYYYFLTKLGVALVQGISRTVTWSGKEHVLIAIASIIIIFFILLLWSG